MAGIVSVRLFGIATMFLSVTLLARWLGPAGYGIYAYVLALVSLIAVPLQNGFRSLIVRETSQAVEEGQWSFVRGVWTWSACVNGLLAIMFAACVLALVAWASIAPYSSAPPVWLLGVPLLPLMVIGTGLGSSLTGLGHVVLGQLPDNVLRPGLFVTGLLLVYMCAPGPVLTAASAMALLVVAAAITVFSMVLLVWKQCPKAVAQSSSEWRNRNWLSALVPLVLASGMLSINSHADILVLGIFVSPEEVGVYRAVTQLATIIIFGLNAVNLLAEPEVARLHAAGDRAGLQRAVTHYARLSLLLALPLGAVLIFAGDQALGVFFGEAYRVGYLPLVILVVGQLVNTAMGSVGLLLNMTGHEKATAQGVAIAVLVNIPLSCILVPYWGGVGAAVATSLSLVVWNLLLWRQVHKRLGISSTAWARGVGRDG